MPLPLTSIHRCCLLKASLRDCYRSIIRIRWCKKRLRRGLRWRDLEKMESNSIPKVYQERNLQGLLPWILQGLVVMSDHSRIKLIEKKGIWKITSMLGSKSHSGRMSTNSLFTRLTWKIQPTTSLSCIKRRSWDIHTTEQGWIRLSRKWNIKLELKLISSGSVRWRMLLRIQRFLETSNQWRLSK